MDLGPAADGFFVTRIVKRALARSKGLKRALAACQKGVMESEVEIENYGMR